MAKLVKDWFSTWLDKHQKRCPSNKWTEVTEEQCKHWFGKFIAARVTEEEAEAASEFVANSKLFPTQHLPEIFNAVQAARANLQSGGRESAELASAECPDCGGNGKVVVSVANGWSFYHRRLVVWRRPERFPNSLLVMVPADQEGFGPKNFTVWCPSNCPLAKWQRQRLEEYSQQNPNDSLGSRIPTLDSLPPESWVPIGNTVSKPSFRVDGPHQPVQKPHYTRRISYA